MKIFREIVKDFFYKNKSKVITFISICCLLYITKVIFLSKAYGSFLDKKNNMNSNIRNVSIIWVSIFTLSYIKSQLEMNIVPEFLSFIRRNMFAHYLKKNEIDFNDIDVSTDVRQIIELTKHMKDLFLWICESIIPIIILVCSINIYFLIKFPKVGMINIVNNISCLYLIIHNYNKIMKKSLEREDLLLKMTEKFDENFNNMMNIFLNNKVDSSIDENNNIENNYVKTYKEQYKDLENFSVNIRICNYLFTIISLYVLYKTTSQQEFIDCLLIFTFYMSTFEGFLEEIPFFSSQISKLRYIEIYLEKKFERITPISSYSQNLNDYKGSIMFRDISFSYKKGISNILDNLSLSINPGEKIAIVSKSGAGKTTMMKLLLAFYKPESGDILLDGNNINDINPQEIREKINYINQRTLLFQDTILNNMKYGNTKTDQEIISFLTRYDLLSIFRDCDKYPDTCLNSMVENNGTNISLGMQKIIFLVRGILKENTVVYIFDEPLSSVDPSTRLKIVNMIKNETKGKTLLIITHDKEVESIVDRVINLSNLQK